jgi:quercetin dioxygenase-like cupin family protein
MEVYLEVKLFTELKKFSPDKMVKVNLFETQNFFCDIYCLEKEQGQKPHTHSDADKIYFVLEGKGLFQIGEEKQTLGVGNTVLAPAGLLHGVENLSEEKLVLLVFMSPNPNIKNKT